MKRNVDLTANKIFCDPNIISSSIVDIFGVKFYPWEVDKIRLRQAEFEPDLGETAAFLCGSASERDRLREEQLYNDGCLCERCGALISLKPWGAFVGCLCSKCSEELSDQLEVKWRYKEPPVWDSDDRVVIEMNKRPW